MTEKNTLLKTRYDPYPTSNTMDKASVPDVNVALEPILRLQQKVGLPRNLDALTQSESSAGYT
jgi:hypothetical protein